MKIYGQENKSAQRTTLSSGKSPEASKRKPNQIETEDVMEFVSKLFTARDFQQLN